eukprot:COSAG06_NODE_60177_length_271_cov_2.912791_1_plen_86_part_10
MMYNHKHLCYPARLGRHGGSDSVGPYCIGLGGDKDLAKRRDWLEQQPRIFTAREASSRTAAAATSGRELLLDRRRSAAQLGARRHA